MPVCREGYTAHARVHGGVRMLMWREGYRACSCACLGTRVVRKPRGRHSYRHLHRVRAISGLRARSASLGRKCIKQEDERTEHGFEQTNCDGTLTDCNQNCAHDTAQPWCRRASDMRPTLLGAW